MEDSQPLQAQGTNRPATPHSSVCEARNGEEIAADIDQSTAAIGLSNGPAPQSDLTSEYPGAVHEQQKMGETAGVREDEKVNYRPESIYCHVLVCANTRCHLLACYIEDCIRTSSRQTLTVASIHMYLVFTVLHTRALSAILINT